MLYKPDWEEAKEHWLAWWNRGSINRATLLVRAPRPASMTQPPPATDVWQQWTDPDYRIPAVEYQMATTYCGGEAFPWFDTNIGPGSLAFFLGSDAILHPNTVWYTPVASAPKDVPPLRLDTTCDWWKRSVRLLEEGSRRGEGKYLTSIPDLIENVDVAASLVGVQPLLYALVDDPSGVKRMVREINAAYFECFDIMYRMLDGDRLGCCFCAFQIWGPGKTAKLQCDFSDMISPEMFAEFVLPGLIEQTEYLDYSIYHLDGPRAIRHLDLLLSIPGLNAIQWTPGDGNPEVGDPTWWPMYRKILAAGKCVHLGPAFKDVEPLVRHLGNDGVYAATWAPSVEAADDLLKRARTW
jgi:hypothetical protein